MTLDLGELSRILWNLLAFFKKIWYLNFNFFNTHFFSGFEANRYQRVRVSFRGDSFLVYAHQLAYWVSQNFAMPSHSSMEISHLCHLPSCAKAEHLTFEECITNTERKACHKAKVCKGHGDRPKCIFV